MIKRAPLLLGIGDGVGVEEARLLAWIAETGTRIARTKARQKIRMLVRFSITELVITSGCGPTQTDGNSLRLGEGPRLTTR